MTADAAPRGWTVEAWDAAVSELVERSTAASGVPEYVEDDTVLARVALLLAGRR